MPRLRLLGIGYLLLEFATFIALGVLLGWGWAFVLFLSGIPIGAVVIRYAIRRADALAVMGGLAFMIPGLWSDLLGLALALPFTQRRLRGRMDAWAQSKVVAMRFPGYQGDVVQGVVIHEEATWTQEPPPTDQGPPGMPGRPSIGD